MTGEAQTAPVVSNESYYRARYYDPVAGRFISEDPIGFSAEIDFYTYVANMPTEISDPEGLLPTSDHFNMTYRLAKKAFGPKCEARARAVAQADADQDATPGLAAKIQFGVGRGEGWRKGSIHFGGPVDPLLRKAFDECNDKLLGAALHGLQDDLTHVGPCSNPSVHFWTSLAYWPFYSPCDDPGPTQIAAIASDTGSILNDYVHKCAMCCQ